MKTVKGICKNLINTVIVCIMAAILFSVMTFCWLADTGNTFVMNFNSSTASAYFAGGNGSKKEPYKISTPVHMYNFAWLQYLGYFNLKDNFNNGRAQSFFELTGNIDMSSIAIPPIGTREYPFIGYFNGNGKTVYNVTVSNSEADFTRRPSTAQFQNNVLTMADSKFTNVDIVGLFGVTGDFNSFISSSYEKKDATTGKKKTVLVNGVPTEIVVKNKEESSGTGTGTTTGNKLEPLPSGNTAENVVYYSGMNVNSMYIDKITVKSVSPKTLVGLAAGYISSTMQDVGVYRSKVSVSSDTDGGVSGITTVKGTVKEYGTTISEYSLVGDYDEENVGWTEVPTDGSGDSAAWGGSIDMRTLNRRLSYMYANGNIYQGSDLRSYSKNTAYNTFLSYGYWRSSGSPTHYNWQANNDIYMHILGGTIIPVNVNTGDMGISSFDNVTEVTAQTVGGTAFKSNQEYVDKKNSGEVVLDSNTGYFVGAGTAQYDSKIRTGIRRFASDSGYGGVIYKSFKNANKGDSITYTIEGDDAVNKIFAMFTLQGSGSNWTTYRIVDNVNKDSYSEASFDNVTNKRFDSDLNFTEYATVRKNFDLSMKDSQTLHGFHFMPYLPSGTITSRTELTNYITKKDVSILGKTKTNYELIKGGLDFTVEKQGKIAVVLGAGYTAASHSLFDLYEVKRNTSNQITKLTQIEKIYEKSNGSSGTSISYNTQPSEDYSLAIDVKSLSSDTKLDLKAAYYFEFPVTAGDYVIGMASGSADANAYLMYLDIGANGNGGGELPYTMQSVDFVSVPTGFDDNNIIQTVKTTDSAGNEKATYPAYKDVGFAVGVGSGTDTVYYKRKSYDSLPSGDGKIETAVYFWRLNKTINVSGFPSSYVGNGGNDDETNAKWWD